LKYNFRITLIKLQKELSLPKFHQKTMNNILVRTISGAVFISLILVPLFLVNPVYAVSILFLFMFLGIVEYGKLFENLNVIAINWKMNTLFSLLISFVFTAKILGFAPWGLPLSLCIFFIWCSTELWREKTNPLLNIGISIFGFMYICAPLLIAIDLHLKADFNFPILAGMFLLIWTNDTFAFLSGKFFGKRKLFERISPKKTWEGTIGGAIFTVLMAWGISYLFDNSHQLFWFVGAVFIVPAAIYGDLLESLFKRSLGVKDSGKIMPGHGGILDRFDASFFAIPFFYFWYLLYINLF